MDANGVQGGRDRFVRGLHAARLCQQAGRHDIAAPLLDGLVAEMADRGIDRWEPALALECLRLDHSSWSSLEAALPAAEKGAATARVRELFAAMCRIDPGAALAAGGPADKKGRRG
jgi:type VI secretion system protein VasJ